MLVLSRKTGQRIWIGPGIEVTVLAIQKGKVRLGFSGPEEVPIHREELHRRIGAKRTQRAAARSLNARDVA